MEERVCQCCAMPLGETDELLGTNADGSKNAEYCKYCYQDGRVLFEGTMDEMIDICVPHMVTGSPGMTAEAARKIMADTLPALKHWQQ
jgi:hypothetical protein